MVLRKNIAGGFVKFVRSDPYAAPVDMLLPRYIEENNLKVYERSPNLFQHISPHSTYSGKVIVYVKDTKIPNYSELLLFSAEDNSSTAFRTKFGAQFT